MNLNLINLDCTEWSKADWNDAYNHYCQHNMFGPKTKQEYYDMVIRNFQKLAAQQKPLSDELKEQWLRGWRGAVAYARDKKCDMNGQLIVISQKHNQDLLAKDIAEDAKEIAVDTAQKLDYLINVAKQRKA